MDELQIKWKTIAYGGSWDILSDKDDIIAVDIPHGAVADHIVNLHNRSLELKKAAPKTSPPVVKP